MGIYFSYNKPEKETKITQLLNSYPETEIPQLSEQYIASCMKRGYDLLF